MEKASLLTLLLFSATQFTLVPSFIRADVNNDKNMQDIDESVLPSQDFYQHAVGNWIRNNPVPPDKPRLDVFMSLGEENYIKMKGIIEDTLKNGQTADEDGQKIGLMYEMGMNTELINSQGMEPIDSELQQIEKIETKEDFARAVGHMHAFNGAPLFNFGSSPDDMHTQATIAEMVQGGLGLPDREYYLSDDENSIKLRGKYLEHIKETFLLMGEDETAASQHAELIFKLERKLAMASRKKEELRDPKKNYNKMSLEELQTTAPGFNWRVFFEEVGVGEKDLQSINVRQPDFFRGAGKAVVETSPDQLKVYLTWNLLRESSPFLGDDFSNEHFEFYGKELKGIHERKERFKEVIDVIDLSLRDIMGRRYIDQYFSPSAKQRASAMALNIKAAMREHILAIDWMSGPTKEKALEKLDKMSVQMGYPSKWRNYQSLEIKDDSFIQNVFRAHHYEFTRDVEKIGKPTDKEDWPYPPQMINAFFMPEWNSIVFPAGILQPPFFSVTASDAQNYGGIGVIVGHEITHAFDDQGRQFDADGNLKDWWRKEDESRFNKKARQIVDQFNGYEPIPGLHLNGELTQGENIADLGGVSIALTALKKQMISANIDSVGQKGGLKDFFYAFANTWKGNLTEQLMFFLVKVDPHAPHKYRVNGPLSNIPEFYEVFKVRFGDQMYRNPEDRIRIW